MTNKPSSRIASSQEGTAPVFERRFPMGAEIMGDHVHVRVWAPDHERVDLVDEDSGKAHALKAEPDGYFSGSLRGGPGLRYRFRLDGGARTLPDPASRFQPDGPHGPSMVVAPDRFGWTDAGWRGVPLDRAILYEMHIGTFTPQGSWAAARDMLPALRDLGITVIELMPVADFPGRFGWGYDGVDLFAPTRLYGTPDDMRAFVDRAHALGIAVILDVVYNHVGPDGNYLADFAAAYFTDRYECEWGAAINFDGPDSAPVRDFFLANVACWIEDYHLDGLRLDATQQIFDASPRHILRAIADTARASGGERTILIVAENEPQDSRLVRPVTEGGYGLDALWNDDFHHSAKVALTGHREAYYSDYRGSAQELISCARWGFLFQGQYFPWQRQRRGTPSLNLPRNAFVTFLQNHDQVANSAHGLRGHDLGSPARWRALTALWLLMPGTPMLFQGQEFAASAPFLFFADHDGDLARAVAQGRGTFLSQFPSIALPQVQAQLAPPHAAETFAACKLDHAERDRGRHAQALALHRDLIALRISDIQPLLQAAARIEGALLSPDCLALRFMAAGSEDRLLIVNLGKDIDIAGIAEPLLAPPEGRSWSLRWSSEAPHYGGAGALAPVEDSAWPITADSATLLAATAARQDAGQR